MKQYPYLADPEFLKKVDRLKNKKFYFKTISLDFTSEREIDSIEGLIKSCSCNVDGSSAIRRTATLQGFCNTSDKPISYFKNFFGLSKKIKLLIGLDNTLSEYSQYSVLWFPMGTYVITNPSISHSLTNGITISLQLKDKMVLLNGDFGGSLPAAIDLDRLSTIDLETGEKIEKKISIYQLIQELVNHIGGEQLGKIIISDVDTVAKQVVVWNSDTVGYVDYDYNLSIEKPNNILKTFSKGDYIGYTYTDFVYPSKDWFSGNAGESVVTLLDKIKTALGNFEYFYDIDGNFIWQEIKDYKQTSKATIDTYNINNEDYLIDISNGNARYSFEDSFLFSSYQNTPQYNKIKNDFIIWGIRTEGEGNSKVQYPIRYHLAIDKKPYVKYEKISQQYNQYLSAYNGQLEQLTEEQQQEVKEKVHAEELKFKQDFKTKIYSLMLNNSKNKDYYNLLKELYDIIDDNSIDELQAILLEKQSNIQSKLEEKEVEQESLNTALAEYRKQSELYQEKIAEIQDQIKKNKTEITNLKQDLKYYTSLLNMILEWNETKLQEKFILENYVNNFSSDLTDIEINDIKNNYSYLLFKDNNGDLLYPNYYENFSSFPPIGEEGSYYIDNSNNNIYSYAVASGYYESIDVNNALNQDKLDTFKNLYISSYDNYDKLIKDIYLQIDTLLNDLADAVSARSELIKNNSFSDTANLINKNDALLKEEGDIFYLQIKTLLDGIQYDSVRKIANTIPKTLILKNIKILLNDYNKYEIEYNKYYQENKGLVPILIEKIKDKKDWKTDKDKIPAEIQDFLNQEEKFDKAESLNAKEYISYLKVINKDLELFYNTVMSWLQEKETPVCSVIMIKSYFNKINILFKKIMKLLNSDISKQIKENTKDLETFILESKPLFKNEYEILVRQKCFVNDSVFSSAVIENTPFTEIQVYENQSSFPSIDEKKDENDILKGYLDVSTGKIYTKVISRGYYYTLSTIEKILIFPCDWRTQLFLQGKNKYAQESNVYYEELNSEWYKLYNIIQITDDLYTAVLKLECLKKPYELDYFIDLIDSNSELFNEINISNIGRRSYVKSINQINCIFSPEMVCDDIIIISSNDKNKEAIKDKCNQRGDLFLEVNEDIFQNCLITSNKYYSAYDEIKNLLYNYTSYNNSITITSVPILYLEPNVILKIKDIYSDIGGDYLLKNYSLQIGTQNSMNLSCTQVIESI